MKTRLATFAAAVVVAAATPLLATTPAQAEPVPEAQRMTLLPLVVNRFDGSRVPFSAQAFVAAAEGASPPAGATYAFTLISCGQPLGTETTADTLSERTVALGLYFTPDSIGPTAEFRVQVTQPGFDPYVLTTTYDLSAEGHMTPTCEGVATADPTYDDKVDESLDETPTGVVTTWSAKKGTRTAAIGKRLAVTPTRANGAKVSYAWKVGSRVVDRDRSMTVKRAYKGKKVAVVITVTTPGDPTRLGKTLRYGKAR